MRGRISAEGDRTVTGQITPASVAELRVLGAVELWRGEAVIRTVLSQPKRMAILILLAQSGGTQPVTREALLEAFWPGVDRARAQAALRQALRFLRSELGPEVIQETGAGQLRSVLASDVERFERLLDSGEGEQALHLYRGEFLAGFHLADPAPAFERWSEQERSRLQRRAVECATQLALEAERVGNLGLAAHWARRAAGFSIHDESLVRQLMELLDLAGDRAGALHAFDTLHRRLTREFQAEPARETRELADRIRARGRRAAAPPPPEPSSVPVTTPLRSVAADRRQVVVLPFSYSGPPDFVFLADGVAEEIRDVLRRTEGLAVASRLESERVAVAEQAVIQARTQLAADLVLQGAVTASPGQVSLRARLVDATSGRELWSDLLERKSDNVLVVQERLVRAVCNALRIAVVPDVAARSLRAPTQDAEAYDLFLRGRHHWNRRPRDTQKGLHFLHLAVARDPLFAQAHAAIADAYNTMGSWESSELPSWDAFPRAHAAARKALDIDPSLSEAHAALAYADMHFRWRWEESEAGYRRSCALDPGYSHAHHWYAHHLVARGRVQEALAEGERALRIDPLNVVLNAHMAWHHWMARHTEETIEACARSLDLEPNDFWAPYFSGQALAQAGRHGEASAQLRTAVRRAGGNAVMQAGLGYVLAAGGERSEALRIHQALVSQAEERRVGSYEVAVISAALERTDEAFEWLQRAYEERSAWLAYAAVEPRLDSLRSDERFASLLHALRL